MNFQQLRILQEAKRREFNFTDVANALFTSQSGVSKHIKDLEDELGIELFERKGKRILGLTPPGQQVQVFVERIVADMQNIRRVAEHFANQNTGQLVVATTHTQARYALTRVVAEFKQRFPQVELALQQGSPQEIAQLLMRGEADIGIATERLADVEELACFPFYEWHHAVIVPNEHPLLQMAQLTLEDIAKYPIITYQEGYTGRALINKAFADQALSPHIVLSALDADVIKAYVELGMGIGIVAPMAFDAKKDTDLKILDCSHLFANNQSVIAVKKDKYLRGFAIEWIQLCNPELSTEHIRFAVEGTST